MAHLQSQMLSDKLKGDIASANQYLANFYGEIESIGGQLYDCNNNPLGGKTDMVDAIFAKSGGDFKRISSNVMSEDNQREPVLP